MQKAQRQDSEVVVKGRSEKDVLNRAGFRFWGVDRGVELIDAPGGLLLLVQELTASHLAA